MPLKITFVNCCICFACCGLSGHLPRHEIARPDSLDVLGPDVKDTKFFTSEANLSGDGVMEGNGQHKQQNA